MSDKPKQEKKLSGLSPKVRGFFVLIGVVFGALILFYVFNNIRHSEKDSQQTSTVNVPDAGTEAPLDPNQYTRASIADSTERQKIGRASGGSSLRSFSDVSTTLPGTVSITLNALNNVDPNILTMFRAQQCTGEACAKLLKDLVAQGKLTREQAQAMLMERLKQEGLDSKTLLALADMNKALADGTMSPEEYAKRLQEMGLSQDQIDALLAVNGIPKDILTASTLSNQKAQIPVQLSKALRDQLNELSSKKLSPQDYNDQIDALVKSGALTQAQADQLKAAYLAAYSAKTPEEKKLAAAQLNALINGGVPSDVATALMGLQAQGASADEYADTLRQLVLAGKISPEEAARLLKNYQGLLAAANSLSQSVSSDSGAMSGQELLAKQADDQQKQAELAQQMQAEQEQAAMSQQAHEAKLQEMSAAMMQQQNELVASWKPTPQEVMEAPQQIAGVAGNEAKSSEARAVEAGPLSIGQKPLIKEGSILYAVLDTAVNSDYPNTPVMAQVVSGKFKGTTLLGKMQTSQNGDRVTLVFTTMMNDAWDQNKTISAYAIDPNSSRIDIASSVNNHYFSRYASVLASSFLQGYGQSLQTTGTLVVPTTTGTTELTNPAALTAQQRVIVGLGTVGQNLSTAAMNNFNKPATVKVDPGVGLGILFTANVQS